MSLVRELDLVRLPDGTLRVAQRPVLPPPDVDTARQPLVLEVEVDASPGTRTEVVLATADDADRVTLTVDGDRRTVSVDRTRSGAVDFHPLFASVDTAPLLGDRPTTHLQLVVDGCVLEVFVDGGLVTLTQQVFPHAPLTELRVTPAPGRSTD
jgi:sucrose-6-phosphate hydrolase SacC (GH32 family)